MPVKLSIPDKLLIAALQIVDSGKEHFSAEDIVVAAWKKFPDAFGLQGYLDDKGAPIYPNSNRVYAEIMGSKRLRKQGLFQKVGNKMYKLTEAGRSCARSLTDFPAKKSPEKWSLGREKVEQIRRLFESKLARKVHSGKLEEVSFFDACGFWGISPRSGAKELCCKFADIESLLDEAQDGLGARSEVSSRHGASPYAGEDIQSLRHIHKTLQKRFEAEISVIKKRTDERKL